MEQLTWRYLTSMVIRHFDSRCYDSRCESLRGHPNVRYRCPDFGREYPRDSSKYMEQLTWRDVSSVEQLFRCDSTGMEQLTRRNTTSIDQHFGRDVSSVDQFIRCNIAIVH
jgi:hypothetical protein